MEISKKVMVAQKKYTKLKPKWQFVLKVKENKKEHFK